MTIHHNIHDRPNAPFGNISTPVEADWLDFDNGDLSVSFHAKVDKDANPHWPLVEFVMQNYSFEGRGCVENLLKILLAKGGSRNGRMLILPVDQGFEHGPHRSFEKNEPAFDPMYHYQLAVDAGLNAFVAPLGALQSIASRLPSAAAGEGVATVLKINSSDYFSSCNADLDPQQAIFASVDDAVELGCVGIGITIYPGSIHFQDMAQRLAPIIREAKSKGLVVIVWAYPRGSSLGKSNNGMQKSLAPNAVDVVSYAAHIACLMGAHIVKVKMPSADTTYWKDLLLNEKLEVLKGRPDHERAEFFIKEVRKACFGGRRLVIFSGGTYIKSDQDILTSIENIAHNNGNGSIIGRNIFQRDRREAIELVSKIKDIYKREPVDFSPVSLG